MPPPPAPPAAPNTVTPGTSTLLGGTVSPNYDSTMLDTINGKLDKILAVLFPGGVA